MWEEVITYDSVHDGVPVEGVAYVHGRVCLYSRVFSESDDEFTDYFRIMEVDKDLLPLLVERWEIWRRWRDAYDSGKVSRDTHPAVPEDRARLEFLEAQISNRDQVVSGNSKCVKGQFRKPSQFVFEVLWSSSDKVS